MNAVIQNVTDGQDSQQDTRAALRFVTCGSVDDGTFFPDPLPPGVPVDGPAWRGFGGDAQHAANSRIATQDLNRIVWSTPLDQQPHQHRRRDGRRGYSDDHGRAKRLCGELREERPDGWPHQGHRSR